MDEPADPPVERLSRSVGAGDDGDAIACLRAFETVPAESRQAALRALREDAERTAPLVPELTPFLTDGERSVRLTAGEAVRRGHRSRLVGSH